MTKQAYSNWLKILKRSWMESTQSDSHEEKKRDFKRGESFYSCAGWIKYKLMTWKSNFENLQFINTTVSEMLWDYTNQWGVTLLLFIYKLMFNNHICSYERKYCCFIKPLNSANKCFAPILTWKKIRCSGVGDIQSHWRETCYYYDQWSANAGLSEEAWFIFVLLDKLLLKSWLILELDGGQRLFEESRNTEWQLCDLREEFCMQMVKGLHCQREWWKLGILN